jgi:uncharacterized protein YggE
MKKTIQILILTLIFSTSIYGQSTERFIRIIGNAKKEIKAEKAKVYFTVSEVKATKYSTNKEDLSYENAYSSVVSKFAELGIQENDIKKAFKKRNKYNKITSKNFFIESDFNNLEKITNIVVTGFRFTDTKYLFGKTDDYLETELSLKAIQDAKRKAKALCDEIKMKVGKILNIEVKQGDFSSRTKESKENSTIKTYKVTITFKLID